jgi:hypothetical protein
MGFIVKKKVTKLEEYCKDYCRYYRDGKCTFVLGTDYIEHCRCRGAYIIKEVNEG